MQLQPAAIALIKEFEGCKLETYRCPRGIATIGWGSTAGVKEGMKISQETADKMLANEVTFFANRVSQLIKRRVTDNQFSAVVCLAYNIGAGALKESTLLRKLNEGDTAGAAQEFLRWTKIQGRESAGLVRRRKAEQALFLKA